MGVGGECEGAGVRWSGCGGECEGAGVRWSGCGGECGVVASAGNLIDCLISRPTNAVE